MKVRYRITKINVDLSKDVTITAENILKAQDLINKMYPTEDGYKHERLCD